MRTDSVIKLADFGGGTDGTFQQGDGQDTPNTYMETLEDGSTGGLERNPELMKQDLTPEVWWQRNLLNYLDKSYPGKSQPGAQSDLPASGTGPGQQFASAARTVFTAALRDAALYSLAAKKTKHWAAAELYDMPTLHQGQTDNLKVDDGEMRVWLSRMTGEDYGIDPNDPNEKRNVHDFDHMVTIEMLRGGRWETVESYPGGAIPQQAIDEIGNGEQPEETKPVVNPHLAALKDPAHWSGWSITPVFYEQQASYDGFVPFSFKGASGETLSWRNKASPYHGDITATLAPDGSVKMNILSGAQVDFQNVDAAVVYVEEFLKKYPGGYNRTAMVTDPSDTDLQHDQTGNFENHLLDPDSQLYKGDKGRGPITEEMKTHLGGLLSRWLSRRADKAVEQKIIQKEKDHLEPKQVCDELRSEGVPKSVIDETYENREKNLFKTVELGS
jgi:hypothetical protein